MISNCWPDCLPGLISQLINYWKYFYYKIFLISQLHNNLFCKQNISQYTFIFSSVQYKFSIIIIIIIIIIIKSTIVITIILSFVLHFFNFRGLGVTFIFEFICVFFTTCFLLFIGFRCNILLTNMSIEILLLALVSLKNFSTFNKRFSKFIMSYNFNCRLVSDLYILFQSFQAVFITQTLGSNFKYQLHCIVACVIIITLNRFWNLKWLINLSSFIFFKRAYLTIKNYRKSSWALPINKYDLVNFFPSLVFIKFLVSIFKTIIDFILRNFINVFLNCKYIFNIFKNEFLVLCIVYTIFTNVTNLCNIFSIFYDYLNFCYFTIFGSIKFAVENFITSTLYFTKLVIYLRDITVSTKELF